MRESSQKTIAKPERGGVTNALFVGANVESLPLELSALASEITINYPWGSLLQTLVTPDVAILKDMACLAKPGASLQILINLSVFENPEYCQKLGLPELTLERANSVLPWDYREAGIDMKSIRILDQASPNRTTWGQKLTKGSGSRKTLAIEAIIR
jgi:16S rRNA (adenine(1408)-N(1))-methyltransferase